MAGALDGVVDSLSVPVERAPLGAGVLSGSGESPGLTKDFHMDVPVDRRPSFAKSAAEDGGVVILAAPSPSGAAAREALLASDQEKDRPAGSTVVMRPRVVEQHRGEGKARRGQGIPVNPTDIGLASRPILIQRQADVDEMGNALDPEGIKPQLFASDGTARGGAKITELGSVTLPDGKVPAPAPVSKSAMESVPFVPGVQQQAPQQPQQPRGVYVAANPKQRIVFEPPSGGRIRASADDVIVSDNIVLVISDTNSDTSYEPAKATRDAPIKLIVGTEVYSVIYGYWSAEKNDKLYMVFVRVPDVAPKAETPA